MMADEQQDDDILELGNEVEQDEAQTPPKDDDLSLEIEGEDDGEETPVVRQLRQRLRDSERELHETRKSQLQTQPVEVGPKPTLESCEYDDTRFERELEEWHGRKNAADSAARKQEEQVQQRNQAFERARGKYQASAAAMKIKGFEQAEKAVLDTLGAEWLGGIVQYADDPAKLVGALGNNPTVLAKLAAEPDPMRRFKMMIDMEKKIVAKRNGPPPPEADTIQRGTAPVAKVTADKRLAALEAQARKSGDRTELVAYRKAKGIKA